MRTQAQQAQAELTTLREQTELLQAETVRWEAQACELRTTLPGGGGFSELASSATAASEGKPQHALAQLEASEALAEQRHRMRMEESQKEREKLEEQLESTTRKIGGLMTDMPRF
mmetsp:Transcript_42670/g.105122  ORF Transcript_42670/g.105122 Transcript_42670/m.105122 type:complete len:115 (+) Transcript_42670:234-578(+)